MRFALVGIACVGCATPTEPRAFENRFSIDQLESEIRVSGPAYQMRFPTLADQVRMPSSLILKDSTEAFAEGGACANESLVGVAVWPAVVAAAGVTGMSESYILHAGPGVAQVRVAYQLPYHCKTTQELTGASTFTFFPSGRIVRHDRSKPLINAFGRAEDCGCQPTNQQVPTYYTTFYTFKGELVDPDGRALVDDEQGQERHCSVAGDHLVAISWQKTNTRVHKSGEAWASVYDWARMAENLQPDEQEITSALKIKFDTDPSLCYLALEGLVDPPLLLDGQQIFTDENGIFRVDDNPPKTHAIELTVTVLVPEFAVSLNLDGRTHARVTRSTDVDANWYTVQPDGENALFWFEDGLAPGETITIEPLE